MTPSPIPIPLPVEVGPHEADWWMVALTALGITATLLIALLTLRANKRADASRKVADGALTSAMEASARAFNLSQESSAAQVDALRALVESQATAKPARNSIVIWRLEPESKNKWIVRNVGSSTAFATTIQGLTEQDRTDLHVFAKEPFDIDPEGFLQITIWRSLASPPSTIIVIKWKDDQGSEYESRLVVT